MTNWDELAPHERIEQVADMLNTFLQHHTYTEWESDHLLGLVHVLEATGVEVEEKLKQLKRTSGGLNRKVAAQGDEIKKLEGRLEELESGGCGFCDGSKKWPEHESKLDSVIR